MLAHSPCIEDLRQRARRNVPKMFFDYADAGSYTEETLRANRADMERIKLRQRVLVDVDQRSTATTILGEPVPLPLALGPIGLGGMMHGDGEILACRAAQAAGIPYTLSTMSIYSIEDVAGAVDKPFWFQLYVMRDRGFIRVLIQRAAAAKCSALVLTVDLQVLGQRHADVRNGLTVPPEIKIKNLIDIATKPAWALSHPQRQAQDLRQSRRPREGHGERQLAGGMDREPIRPGAELEGRRMGQEPLARQAHPQGHPRRRGRQDRGDDRRRAPSCVSNHGGRQLDGAPSSISALPSIVDAVGSEIEVMFDSGIRPGRHDAGAGARRAFLHRRPRLHLWIGRRRAGRRRRAIEILRKELDVTMALCGVSNVRDLDRRVIVNA